jgi:hypothetical protein
MSGGTEMAQDLHLTSVPDCTRQYSMRKYDITACAAENTDTFCKDKHISSSIVSDLGLSAIPNGTGRTKHGYQQRRRNKGNDTVTIWQEMDLNIR